MQQAPKQTARWSAALAVSITLLPLDVEAARPCEAKSIVGGGVEICVIRDDGRVACWGDHDLSRPFSPSPAGSFSQVSIGEFYGCGVRTDDTATCWGKDEYAPFPEPQGLYKKIWVGSQSAWGLRPDGAVVLVDAGDADPAPVPPDGIFLDIEGLCGLRPDHTVDCWNGVTPLDGTFQQLSGPCGLRTDGSVACDRGFESIVGPAPEGVFTRLSAIADFSTIGACAIRPDGSVACWGDVEGSAPTGSFREIAIASNFGGVPCGIRTDGTVSCTIESFDTDYRNAGLVVGSFTQVGAGGDPLQRPISCAIDESGSVDCWGSSQYGQTSPPEGEFQQLSAGDYHACGLHTDGTIACWGDNTLKDREPPQGTFSQIASGNLGPNCALRTDNSVACWGFGVANLDTPDGQYVQVAAGGQRACALDDEGDPTCWQYVYGASEDDVVAQSIDAPPGPFTQLSASGEFSTPSFLICGLRTNGSIECWGDNVQGFLDAPEGEFVQVSCGGGGSCALGSDGLIQCWGGIWDGVGSDAYEPPQGEFVKVAMGYLHACGLTADGSVVCAGEEQAVSFCDAAPLCGNGVVDDREACDDGDIDFAQGDACTRACFEVPCGQPVSTNASGPSASDAQFALRTAVGIRECDLAVCDINNSATVSVVDALGILTGAVDLPISFDCPL